VGELYELSEVSCRSCNLVYAVPDISSCRDIRDTGIAWGNVYILVFDRVVDFGHGVVWIIQGSGLLD
jgi:hypothetical protein